MGLLTLPMGLLKVDFLVFPVEKTGQMYLKCTYCAQNSLKWQRSYSVHSFPAKMTSLSVDIATLYGSYHSLSVTETVLLYRYHWADSLSEKIKDTQWLYSLVRPVVRGQYSDTQYNRDMNLLFIKLHLLDPTAVFPAYDHLRKGEGK